MLRQVRTYRSKMGMTTLEYSVVVLAMVIALLAVQVSLRRAISYKWREAADSFGSGRQYDSGVMTP